MNIDLNLLCLETADLVTIKELMKKRDPDSKEVVKFTKDYGLGTPEWQSAMIRRINNKVKQNKELTDIDKTFIHLQNEHNKWVLDQLKSMGIQSICMN